MIVDMRTYTLFPGLLAGYLEHYEKKGLPIQKRHLGDALMAYFLTEAGQLNQVIHFWRYDSLADREAKRARMVADPEWTAYLGSNNRDSFIAQENRILKPAPFWPDRVPAANRAGPAAYVDIRTYTARSGNIADYFKNYEANGLMVQLGYIGHCIGYFASGDIGRSHQIVHLWGYQDLNDRQERRAAMAADPAWQNYGRLAGPLLSNMENRIVRPAAFSPVR
jgi:hypothetical protein